MRIAILAATLIASSASLLVQPAGAAPMSSMLALQNADVGQVETVQWRRRGSGRWIGPAAGIATGLAIAGAVASQSYYGDYGYSPYGYAAPAYGYAPVESYDGSYGYRGWAGSVRRGCTQENRDDNPMCQ
jgi:hypothetical protein